MAVLLAFASIMTEKAIGFGSHTKKEVRNEDILVTDGNLADVKDILKKTVAEIRLDR